MIDLVRAFKITAVLVTGVWVVCFVGVALFPESRQLFMQYALHVRVGAPVEDILTFTTFVSGLVFWNVAGALFAWFYVTVRDYFTS